MMVIQNVSNIAYQLAVNFFGIYHATATYVRIAV